jgi:hypothetical protein
MNNPFSFNPLGSDMVAQIAWIVVPNDVDRDAYAQTFYQTGILSVASDGGEFFTKVSVPKHLISEIVIPYSKLEKGNAVLIITPEKYPTAKFITAVLPYNNTLDGVLEENCMYERREAGDNVIEVIGNANNASYQINIDSANHTGEFSITLKTQKNSIQIDANADGELSFVSTNSITKYAQNEIKSVIVKNNSEGKELSSFLLKDDEATLKVDDKVVTVTKSGVSVGKEKNKLESGVLGDTLIQLLNTLCQTLSVLKTDPATGVILSPDSALILQIQAQLSTALAKFVKVN